MFEWAAVGFIYAIGVLSVGHTNVPITADTYAKWIRPVGRGVVNTLAISSLV